MPVQFTYNIKKQSSTYNIIMGTEAKVQHIFDLFDKFGHEMYIGESVTQLQVRALVYEIHIIIKKKMSGSGNEKLG